MSTAELAQKILDMIAETEKALHDKPGVENFLLILDEHELRALKDSIKGLCQQFTQTEEEETK